MQKYYLYNQLTKETKNCIVTESILRSFSRTYPCLQCQVCKLWPTDNQLGRKMLLCNSRQ